MRNFKNYYSLLCYCIVFVTLQCDAGLLKLCTYLETCSTSDDKITLDEALRYAKQAENATISPSKKNIVLLGNTGSGKSTLANLLVGNRLEVKTIRPNDKRIVLSDPGSSVAPIGYSWYESTTDTITPIRLDDEVTIWDCPGFFDSKGVSKTIKNAFMVNKLINSADQVKFVIVISATEFDSAKGDVADTCLNLIKDIFLFNDEKLKQCITIVITKLKSGKEWLLDDLKLFAKERGIEHLIDPLLQNNQVTFFHEVQEYADRDAIPEAIADRLMNTISKSDYVNVENPNIALSKGALLALTEMLGECISEVKTVTGTIFSELENRILYMPKERLNNILNSATSFEHLRDLNVLIKNGDARRRFLDACDKYDEINQFLTYAKHIASIKVELFDEKEHVTRFIEKLRHAKNSK